MIVYRGSSSSDFKAKEWQKSRYGIKALFFATNVYLARLYAIHRAKEECIRTGGFVYEFDIPGEIYTCSFDGKSSYSREFRNLIYALHKEKYQAVRITDVLDYPSKELLRPTGSDVVVIFDFKLIKSYKLIESGVKKP